MGVRIFYKIQNHLKMINGQEDSCTESKNIDRGLPSCGLLALVVVVVAVVVIVLFAPINYERMAV